MGMPVLSSLSFTFFSMNSISAAKYKHKQRSKQQRHSDTWRILEAIEDLDHPQSFHTRVSGRKPPGKDRRMVKMVKEIFDSFDSIWRLSRVLFHLVLSPELPGEVGSICRGPWASKEHVPHLGCHEAVWRRFLCFLNTNQYSTSVTWSLLLQIFIKKITRNNLSAKPSKSCLRRSWDGW